MKAINDELKQEITEMHLQGKTYNEIAEITGISKGSISNICKTLNGKEVPIELTQEKIKELQALYDTIGNIKEVARISKISYNRLRNVIISKTITPKTNYENVRNYRKSIKEKLVSYKGGKCVICGYDTCIEALDFHHTNPEEKEFNIAGQHKNIDTLKAEVDKCVLVCCRCHREIHAGLIKLN